MQKRVLLLLVLGMLFSSSIFTGVSAQGCNIKCTFEFKPVCAVLHGKQRTFPNACAMRSENSCYRKTYRQIHDGPCNGA